MTPKKQFHYLTTYDLQLSSLSLPFPTIKSYVTLGLLLLLLLLLILFFLIYLLVVGTVSYPLARSAPLSISLESSITLPPSESYIPTHAAA